MHLYCGCCTFYIVIDMARRSHVGAPHTHSFRCGHISSMHDLMKVFLSNTHTYTHINGNYACDLSECICVICVNVFTPRFNLVDLFIYDMWEIERTLFRNIVFIFSYYSYCGSRTLERHSLLNGYLHNFRNCIYMVVWSRRAHLQLQGGGDMIQFLCARRVAV